MSKRYVGKVLIAINYLLPFLIVVLTRVGGGLTEAKLIKIIVLLYIIYPTMIVLLNISISKLMELTSLLSALLVLSGLLLIDIADILIGLFYDTSAKIAFDRGTINIIIVRLAYYVFISLLYYLIKKDDNIIPAGDSK